MLAKGSAAQCMIGALLNRTQVTWALCSQGGHIKWPSSRASTYDSLRAAQQQISQYHTTNTCSSSQQPEAPSTADAVASSSNAADAVTSSTAADTDDGLSTSAAQPQQRRGAHLTADGFVHKESRSTGYSETFLAVRPEAESSSGAASPRQQKAGRSVAKRLVPRDTLRIQLKQEVQKEETEVQVDAYSLSRSLVGDTSSPLGAAAATADQQQQQQLTAADKEALEKLVGILTKDGKKSRARRILLDAMHIIKQQLAKGQHSA